MNKRYRIARWGLLFLVGAIALWQLFLFIPQLHLYFRLSETTLATVSKWEFQESKEGLFIPIAFLSYTVEHKSYTAQLPLPSTPFLNRYAAEKGADQLPSELSLFFDPDEPQTAALERFFPWTQLINLFILLILGLYFFFFLGSFQDRGERAS